MHRYGIQPHRSETRWKAQFSTEVIPDTDKAIEAIRCDNPDVKVFTDGSGMDRKIGAAAVLYRSGRPKTKLRHQLGPQRHHTVYEGEGIRALLGIKLIANEWNIRSAFIYIDNRAAIAATQLTKPNPGHYIFDTIHKNIGLLRKKHAGIKITIKWVPGHKGVEGNEHADEEAKKAITDGSSGKRELPTLLRKALPHSKSAAKWTYNEKLKRFAQKSWQKSKHYDRMKKTDPTAPSNKFINLVAKLPRKLASILAQLRTGHSPLAKHLHRIGKMDSPICPACSQSEETIQHFIVHCTAHQVARQALRDNTGGRNIDTVKLFTSPKTLHALFRYIAETGCFHNTFGDLPELAEEERNERARR
jgi:ribonuclease HI